MILRGVLRRALPPDPGYRFRECHPFILSSTFQRASLPAPGYVFQRESPPDPWYRVLEGVTPLFCVVCFRERHPFILGPVFERAV